MSSRRPATTDKTPVKTNPPLKPITDYTIPQLTTLLHEHDVQLETHALPVDRTDKRKYLYNLLQSTLRQKPDVQQWAAGWSEHTTTKPSPRSPKSGNAQRRVTPAKRKKDVKAVKSESDVDDDDDEPVVKPTPKRRSSIKPAVKQDKQHPTAAVSSYIDPDLLSMTADDDDDVDGENDAMSIEQQSTDESDTERYVESQPRRSLRPNEFQTSSHRQGSHTPVATTQTQYKSHPAATPYTNTNTSTSQRNNVTSPKPLPSLSKPQSRSVSSPVETRTIPTLSSRYTQPIAQPHVRTKSRLADELQNDASYFESMVGERMKSTFDTFRQKPSTTSAPRRQTGGSDIHDDIGKLSLRGRRTSLSDVDKPDVVPSPEPSDIDTVSPSKHKQQKRHINPLTWLVPLLLSSLVGLTGLALQQQPSLYAYWPFILIEPFTRPFCPSDTTESRLTPLFGAKQCVPCPPHGHCTLGHVYCEPLYVRHGDMCVESKKLHNQVGYYTDLVVDHLQRHKGLVECGYLADDAVAKGMFEPEVRTALFSADNDALNSDLVYHKTLTALQHRNDVLHDDDYYEAMKSIKPFTCRVRQYIQSHILEVSGVSAVLSAISYAVYKVKQWFRRRRQTKDTTEDVLDLLQSSDAPLAVDHIRRDVECNDIVVWRRVCDAMASDTRVEKSQSKFGQVKRDSWYWTDRHRRSSSRKSLNTAVLDGDSDVIMSTAGQHSAPSQFVNPYTSDALHVTPPSMLQYSDNVAETENQQYKQQQQTKSTCVVC